MLARRTTASAHRPDIRPQPTRRSRNHRRSFDTREESIYGLLKLVRPKQYKQLLELNRIRNNWVLEIKRSRVTAGGRRRLVRVPSIIFEGQNLFDEQVFTDRFLKVNSKIYLKLLFIAWKLQGKL